MCIKGQLQTTACNEIIAAIAKWRARFVIDHAQRTIWIYINAIDAALQQQGFPISTNRQIAVMM